MDFHRRNSALDINRPNANRNLSEHGSDWLWAVTAVFGTAFLSWLLWTLLRFKSRATAHQLKKGGDVNTNGHLSAGSVNTYGERIFHYLWTLAAFIGLISYFTMASDLGNTPIRQYLHNGGNAQQTRQVYYVRYIYWFLAWPLIVTANLLLSGVSWATIFFAIALQEIWVVSWLSGALVATSYKWGFFAFGIFAYLVLAYIMLVWGVEHARRIRIERDYTFLAGTLVLLWMGFPVAWGLCEGSNRLSILGEMIFYGILDFIAVPVYGTLFLIYSRRIVPSAFKFTQYGRVPAINIADSVAAGGHHASGIAEPGGV